MNEKIKRVCKTCAAAMGLLMLMLFCACSSLTSDCRKILLVKFPDLGLRDFSSFKNSNAISRWYVKIEGDSYSDCFFVTGSEFTFSVEERQLLSITAFPLVFGATDPSVLDFSSMEEFSTTTGEASSVDFEQEVQFFCCAGAILPYSLENCSNGINEIELAWEDGFCAYVMQRLFKGSSMEKGRTADFILEFNWEKMMELVRSKIKDSALKIETDGEIAGNAFYNPWLLDVDVVVQKIADRKFTASALNLKGVFTAECGAAISAFVPENEFILKYGRATLRKNCANLFMTENSKGVILCGDKEKNLSATKVYMPIFCKGL